MTDMHGIIYAFQSNQALGELVSMRTSASIPFGGRYRLIDFMLSSMTNAGVKDVGIIMQRDYQSLLNHLGSGKEWDLSRNSGGLQMLPPFGLPDSRFGEYGGCMEALAALRSYIEEIHQPNIVLAKGDLCANIDLRDVLAHHLASGAQITAVCSHSSPDTPHNRLVINSEGFVSELLLRCGGDDRGLATLDVYIVRKSVLLELIDWCAKHGKAHFHRNAVTHFLSTGGRMGAYIFDGLAMRVDSIMSYYSSSMALLDTASRLELFPNERPVRTRGRAEVSTYYGEEARVVNSLVADGCYIEGELENCVLFRNVKVARGAKLKNCIIMHNCIVPAGSQLSCIIADKDVKLSVRTELAGSPNLPIIIPKGTTI